MSNINRLDNMLNEFVERGLPGCGLKVTKGNETLYEGYAGYSNIENKIPVTENSLFRQASMSKIPLYTTMMMLYERGYFLLSDPISNYFPEWKESKKYVRYDNGYSSIVPTDRPITIADTLSMKCGLPYCNGPGPTDNPTLQAMQEAMKPLWEKGHFTIREQIAAMAEVPQAFEPGTHWLYGFSSELAAGIVEEVCQKSIDDVFEELLFDPLEMHNTRSHYFEGAMERMVTLYGKSPDNKLSPMKFPLDDKHLPGEEHQCGWARLFSTVNDYSHLMQMLACGGKYKGKHIMGRKTIDLMRTNTLTPEMQCDIEDTYNAGYGYGYGVRTLIAPERGHHNGSIGSFGWTGAFGTWCESDPKEELSIVYMHNMIPDEELYFHLRVRNVVNGIID